MLSELEEPPALIDRYIASDCQFLHLYDALKPTVSGLQETDYPCLSNPLRALSQLHQLNDIAFPIQILEKFNHSRSNSDAGMFSEINRAWLAADNQLYLWSFNGGCITSYDALKENIVGVGLVKPIQGVFKEFVKHVVCVTTSTIVVLLGLKTENDTVEIMPEPLFTIPTDNILMGVIAGTNDGRIFLGGKEGSLCEVAYQGPSSWFGKKSWKTNHSTSIFSYIIPSILDFSGKIPIVQIEIDESRHVLYARYSDGTIDVYDLGSDGKGLSKVTSRSWSSISSQAQSLAQNIDVINFKTLIAISVVEETESPFISLVGFTDTGVRIFFITSRTLHQRPEMLDIAHIRMPPTYTATITPQKPSNVHLASYRRGTTVMASTFVDGRTILWAMSSDAFPFDSQFMELFTVHQLGSKTWCMQEAITPPVIKQYAFIHTPQNKTITLEPPVLVTQDMESQRKYVFLSSQGIHTANHPRPVDHLKQLLIDNHGFENEAVRSFFRLYGEAQSCCMALSIACNCVSHLEKQVAEWATLAFFRYGGDPQLAPINPQSARQQLLYSTSLQQQRNIPTENSNIIQLSTPFSSTPRNSPDIGLYQQSSILSPSSPSSPPSKMPFSPQTSMIRFSPNDIPEYQRTPSRDFLLGKSPQPTSVTAGRIHYEMSTKLVGLYLYVSRIVRPIWNFTAVKVEPVIRPLPDCPKEIFSSSILDTEMNIYLEKLNNLRAFMDKNIQFSPDPRNDMVSGMMNGSVIFANPNQINPLLEKNSFFKVSQLIESCIEVIGLWRIIYEHNFQSIIQHLSPEAVNVLRNVTFRDLIIAGGELCAHLASALVQKYIEDHTATDCISQRLKEACPSIFRSENALQAKAHEIIIKARTVRDLVERSKMIDEGVRTFKRIGARINIRQACELLKTVHAYIDLANLCLSAASQRDFESRVVCGDANLLQRIQNAPKNLDLLAHTNGTKPTDLDSRLECYRIILEVYEYLQGICENPVLPEPVNSQAGQKTTAENVQDENVLPPLTNEEATNYSQAILKSIIASDDKVAHFALYEWFYEHNKLDKLLDIRSPYVESYLKNKTFSGDSNLMMDLLWMYYERSGNYRAAAHILNQLAERHSSEIGLLKRIEYLSRAILCIKSCQSHSAMMSMDEKELKTSGELLHDLEEKMEVARLQLTIMECLNQRSDSSRKAVQDALKELNEDLIDISALYEKYAETFDLPECQLAIVYAASHHDPDLVKSLWKKIIDKELQSSMAKPVSTRKTILADKIRNLTRLYLPSDRYFPIQFIIQYLEDYTLNLQIEKEWLVEAFLSCGLSIPQLVDIYYKLYRKNDSTISWSSKSIPRLQISAWLFKKFCENPQTVPINERRQFTAKCLDIVAEYVIDIQSNCFTDPIANQLISQFRELQSNLERMTF